MFITDGLDQYHIAFKKVFYALKGIRAIHVQDIHIRNPDATSRNDSMANWKIISDMPVA